MQSLFVEINETNAVGKEHLPDEVQLQCDVVCVCKKMDIRLQENGYHRTSSRRGCRVIRCGHVDPSCWVMPSLRSIDLCLIENRYLKMIPRRHIKHVAILTLTFERSNCLNALHWHRAG